MCVCPIVRTFVFVIDGIVVKLVLLILVIVVVLEVVAAVVVLFVPRYSLEI